MREVNYKSGNVPDNHHMEPNKQLKEQFPSIRSREELMETSPKEFRDFPDDYIHHSRQIFDTGLELEMLQEFFLIPLDIFKKKMHNKNIENERDAWLTFLCFDEPEDILRIIEKYPDFRILYERIYGICQNVEKVMEMFSEELKILDKAATFTNPFSCKAAAFYFPFTFF